MLFDYMAFDWKPEYSVNVKEIDEEHKKLVNLIDKLYHSIYSFKTKEDLGNILNELIEFADYHFSTEEKYFEKYNYENSTEHKKEHRMFEDKVLDISKKFKNNEMEISFELIDFLEDWLLDHLVEQDQKYVKCFTEHGLS